MAKIGDVEFNLISENRKHQGDVTSYPVENGADISDHVNTDPIVYEIEGHVGDSERPGHVHERLKNLFYNKELVDYTGRSAMNKCIIKSFSSNVSSRSKKGFTFSLTIINVTVAKPSTSSLLPISLKIDAKDIGNAGRVKTI